MTPQEIDLPKLAGVAGSAVGMVIATAILLSWLTARYVPAFDRYRVLASEYRDGTKNDSRRNEVREQLVSNQRRLIHLNRASCTLSFALLSAIITIVAAGVSMLLPGHLPINLVGTAALFGAFGLFAVAVVMFIVENRIDRRSINADVRDLDGIPSDDGPAR